MTVSGLMPTAIVRPEVLAGRRFVSPASASPPHYSNSIWHLLEGSVCRLSMHASGGVGVARQMQTGALIKGVVPRDRGGREGCSSPQGDGINGVDDANGMLRHWPPAITPCERRHGRTACSVGRIGLEPVTSCV